MIRMIVRAYLIVTVGLTCLGMAVPGARGQAIYLPEQTRVQVRDPATLPSIAIPETPAPPTVSRGLPEDAPTRSLTLDDAIRIALENTRVVRVLTGVTASGTGRTIYDVAITNTGIDQQNARFDPRFQAAQSFDRVETPQATLDPNDPSRALITGGRVDQFTSRLDLARTNAWGGVGSIGITNNPSRFRPGVVPLNPQARSALELRYEQPLWQGAGRAVNQVPIVVARIDTERSYFQFKDIVQEQVRSVIEGYWLLVAARVDVWARQQQVSQAAEALRLAEARLRSGLGSAADTAQARSALANFRASLINSRAALLNREAAMRNVLGLPPYAPEQLVPTTPPATERLQPDWRGILELAEQRRPDLIELKLVLEADEQLWLQANNQARPRLDAVALYRWNGLEGEMPIGDTVSSRSGQFTDWTLGINFSVPIGLRQGRASLRRQELVLARDRANLDQGMHNAVHVLAGAVRNLDQFYEQYLALVEAREAARANLEIQRAQYELGRVIFLNVLQAISDWGNVVSAEAQALAQYNAALAALERQTGTILETHGIRLYEERLQAAGPLGRWGQMWCYPAFVSPRGGPDRYPEGTSPSEEFFDLEEIPFRRRPGVAPAPASPEQSAPLPESLPPPNPAP